MSSRSIEPVAQEFSVNTVSKPSLPAAENPASIQEMFGQISRTYDRANTVISLGLHSVWKKRLVKKAAAQPGHRVLDCATGTGDLAFLFESKVGKNGQVIGVDFCEPMLEVARERAARKSEDTQSRVRFQFADVTNLPFDSNAFDLATISYGIRNVKNTQKALAELGRVVKPGGQVLILEFGQPTSRLIGALYRFYSQKLLPRLGAWINGNKKAYEYLETSSAKYPCGDQFLNLARATGHFSSVSYDRYLTGVMYIYSLTKAS